MDDSKALIITEWVAIVFVLFLRVVQVGIMFAVVWVLLS